MALSQIWRDLPGDLAEQTLTQLVAAHFHTDPAYTWVCLRQLSAHQKRVIEHRFGQFWLPKLSITLYTGARHKFEYAIDPVRGRLSATRSPLPSSARSTTRCSGSARTPCPAR
jgi:hypothetical protein